MDLRLTKISRALSHRKSRPAAVFPGVGCLFLLVAMGFASAQAAERWVGLTDMPIQYLARDNELPNSAVPTALAEDSDGFLWIGSQNGVARWDGYHFRVSRSEHAKEGSLPDNFVQTLHTDARGRLWIGTSSGGLARYERTHDRFIVYGAGPEGLSHVSVRDIADDGAGGIWVATDGGLDHLPADSARIEHFRHRDDDTGSIPDDQVRAVLRDHRGTLWVATTHGVARRAVDSTRFEPVALPTPEAHQPSTWALLEASDGRIWVGSVRHGAYIIDPATGVAVAVQESGPGLSLLQTEDVDALIEARPGEVWLGTLGHGIVVVDTTTSRTRRVRHDPTLPAALADDTIQSLHKDRAGLVWICSDRGLGYYDPGQSAVLTVFGASSRADGISASNVDSVFPLSDDRIWLGLDSNGVDVIDPAGRRVAELRPDPAHPETSLPKDYINSFVAEPSGDVYVGTEQGLYRADRAALHAVRIPVPQRDPTAAVWTVLLADRVLWIGGFDGLWALDPATRQAPPRFDHNALTRQLTDQRVTVFEASGGDSLWIGTKNGLNRLDLRTRTVERILPDKADSRALSGAYVTSLLTDARGRLWVGTLGGGVSVLESRDEKGRPRFRRLGSDEGLINDNANKLLEDRQKNVWVSTDNGLAVVDEETFAIRTLRRAEGVAISSYWVGAGAVTAAGELLFGGVGGLTVVRPDRLSHWAYHPPVVVTDIRVGGRSVASREIGPDGTGPITISPKANNLAVEFAALDYSSPERNRYAYRLDDFDPDWVDTDSTRRLAVYTNLPAGDYTLRLRGSNRDGVWVDQAVGLPVRVLPAWYQTLSFRILAGFLALGLLAALVQGRTLYLRRNQRDLERQVIERTKELRESQRQLEKIAYFDTLTALPNRRMFTEEVREQLVLARLEAAHFALLLIDLDRFKRINDSLGHDAGDALLIEASIRLQAAVRKSDCVARLGGDEFAVLVANNPAATDIEAICQRITENFVMPVLLGQTEVRASASIGVAVFPEHGATMDNLYKSADIALYDSKRAGGQCWRWYRPRDAGSTVSVPVI
ncbi:MAG TPA: diguanylate cyclase [Steroidobacteraceae bacterium]|nr:diguanylate cyclase [Steroidobacteraceae bacterium]